MHLVDFQAQSHLPKIILNGFCFMTVNVQMYYETEQTGRDISPIGCPALLTNYILLYLNLTHDMFSIIVCR